VAKWAYEPAPEIVRIARQPGSILVLPLGSLEQHGPHLPAGTDTFEVSAIVAAAVEGLGGKVPVLVTPPLWVGHSPENMPFGGTISASFERLLHLIEDMALSAAQNGFRAIVLVNGHGGNQSLVDAAVTTLNTDLGCPAEVFGVTYWTRLVRRELEEIIEDDVALNHAGELETSLMLHIHPELVKTDRFPDNSGEIPYRLGAFELTRRWPIAFYPRSFAAEGYSKTGAFGNVRLASKEKGERIFLEAVRALREFLMAVHRKIA
jgi:creatinine amidohydrolase